MSGFRIYIGALGSKQALGEQCSILAALYSREAWQRSRPLLHQDPEKKDTQACVPVKRPVSAAVWGGGSEACQQSWQHRQHKQRLYERMSVNQSQERRHCEQGQQGNKSKQGKVGKQGTLWVHIL